MRFVNWVFLVVAISLLAAGVACKGLGPASPSTSSSNPPSPPSPPSPPASSEISVQDSGNGLGTVTSSPAGINCGAACIASFPTGSQVTLRATAGANSNFMGWASPCEGTGPCVLKVSKNLKLSAMFNVLVQPPPPMYTLTITLPGDGNGSVTSSPGGISCPPTCDASFQSGAQVSLTSSPAANAYFAGWGGSCTGTGSCQVTLTQNESVSSTIKLWPFNHIIFMAQENHSLDDYFGAMRAYWAANGIPDQSFDGLPQFNPTQGIPPLYGPPPTNPTCDPNANHGLPFNDCVVDNNSPIITSFHFITHCVEDPAGEWDAAHYSLDWANPYIDPLDDPPMNGYASVMAHGSKLTHNGLNHGPYYDTIGMRVMGYYDWTDLNFYYFMATDFATSDRFFSAVMTNTQSNREYMIAATSQGETRAVGSRPEDKELTATTIYQLLDKAGISWKIYVDPAYTPCNPPYQTSCLVTYDDVYLKNFSWGYQNLQYGVNLGTVGPAGTCGSSPCDFENDLANGTLPQIVQIEPGSPASLDEHPTKYDEYPVDNQAGAQYVEALINELMQSSSWADSVFFLTFDEDGGFFDHVPQQPTVSPDGIAPVDLYPDDICYGQNGPTCDFTWTGSRVPLIVISPFTKQNYVSHTVEDLTAILKFIETRFALAPLTKRDAAQPVMSEYFDFTNPPWLTPPTPPAQVVNGECYLNKLP
jgi:phospholipase C